MVGDRGVGKTSLINRFCDNTFSEQYIASLDVKFKLKEGVEYQGKRIDFQIWDSTYGFSWDSRQPVSSAEFKIFDAIFVAYDVTDQVSFNDVELHLEYLDRYARVGIPKIIIGNKCDLSRQKVVDCNAVKEFADSLGIKFVEVSAKEGSNVEAVFIAASEAIFEKHRIAEKAIADSKKLKITDNEKLMTDVLSLNTLKQIDEAAKQYYNDFIKANDNRCSNELKLLFEERIRPHALKIMEVEMRSLPDKASKLAYLRNASAMSWLVDAINPGFFANYVGSAPRHQISGWILDELNKSPEVALTSQSQARPQP